jgi:hypothetical protein
MAKLNGLSSPPQTAQTKKRTLGELYEGVRRRIIDLVGDLNEDEAKRIVPATPEWSIKDVIAHLTGNCADTLSGNIGGAATVPWTAVQVQTRADRTLPEVIVEWDEVGPAVAALIDDFPGRAGGVVIADVTSHEHDLRHALGRPGERDSQAVTTGLDYLMRVVVRPGARALEIRPLLFVAGTRSWVVGHEGGPEDAAEDWRDEMWSDGEVEDVVAEPVAAFSIAPFELFRAVTGRRSAAQITSYNWPVDPDPYLGLFELGPFTRRTDDLIE